jgi:hypothetical protein
MSKAIVVGKARFDALLGKMINADPLPYSRMRKNSFRSERSTTKLSCFHNPT